VSAALIRAVAPWLAAAFVGAFLWTFTPVIGPLATVARAERQRDDATGAAKEWERHARGWMAAYGLSENARLAETKDARAAVQTLAARCDVRVAEARRSARAIETLIHKEPSYETVPDVAGRCPVRSLADPDELRRALQPSG
jgi:hypothetical protein